MIGILLLLIFSNNLVNSEENPNLSPCKEVYNNALARIETDGKKITLFKSLLKDSCSDNSDTLEWGATYQLASIYLDLKNKDSCTFYFESLKSAPLTQQEYEAPLVCLLQQKYFSQFESCTSYDEFRLEVDTSIFTSDEGIYSLYYTDALTYRLCGNPIRSIASLKKCRELKVSESLKVHALILLGQIAKAQKDYEFAIDILEEAKSIAVPQSTNYARILATLGNAYLRNNQFEKSLSESEELLRERSASSFLKISALNDMSSIYIDQKQNNKAHRVLEEGLTLALKDSLHLHRANIYANQGIVYLDENRAREAYENFKKAEGIYISLDGKKHQDNVMLSKEFQLVAMSKISPDENLGKTLDAYISLRDSLEQINLTSSIQEYKVQYETEKKELENQQLELKNENQKLTINRQRLLMALSLSGVGAFLWISFLLFQNVQKSKRLNSALTAYNQETKHRIRNSLTFLTTFVKGEARRSEHKETQETLLELNQRIIAISLIDRSLSVKDENSIHLEEYMSSLLNQILMATGTDVRPTLHVHVEPLVCIPESVAVLGIIVNELVVNSLKHAFANVDDPIVQISITHFLDQVLLEYEDNGKGFEALSVEENIANESYGRFIIQTLVKQLKGKSEVRCDEGFQFACSFPSIEILV